MTFAFVRKTSPGARIYIEATSMDGAWQALGAATQRPSSEFLLESYPSAF